VLSTNYAWDETHFYAAYSVDPQAILITGMCINSNADVVGVPVGVNVRGVQRTLRTSRTRRKQLYTAVGPLRDVVIEAYREIRLSLDTNEAGLTFDLHWLGSGPPCLSDHPLATVHGRHTTYQTRGDPTGTAGGWIEVLGESLEVSPRAWGACRDDSWGIDEARPTLASDPRWLPPAERSGTVRALRFSIFSQAG
jgi:hypothetical protein